MEEEEEEDPGKEPIVEEAVEEAIPVRVVGKVASFSSLSIIKPTNRQSS